ncbi:unnamed protein product [Durusdinium trenchii]|uniref:EF-hand domain-containing protein n=1 Tax=Durusdinium trenchii TaxID=1381693 RepID=A0ABP0RVB1_9DINO
MFFRSPDHPHGFQWDPSTAYGLKRPTLALVDVPPIRQAMSEVMAKAEEEARDFVVEKAEELGEDGALEAALMEAFVAFDSDNDGKLIGQELAVLLEVSGRTVPPELLQEFQSKDFECDYDEFTRIYARTWRNERLEDDEEFEGSDEV